MWRAPSIKRLVPVVKVFLRGVDDADAVKLAREIRKILLTHKAEDALREACTVLGNPDVEWIGFECTRDSLRPRGIWYLNVGDPYDATIFVRDNGGDMAPSRGTYEVGSWGDVVEAHERKCAACKRLRREEW